MWVKVKQPADDVPPATMTSEAVPHTVTVNDSARQLPQQLPSTIFAIPFPKPVQHNANDEEPVPFLLYTFPRSVYEKPPKDPVTGKRGKEKLVKKFERKWQEEVKEGRDIKRGQHKAAGRLKRAKGAIARVAASTIQWLPNNVMEVLARLPPPKKIGKVSIIYPESVDMPWFNTTNLSKPQIQKRFWDLLMEAKKSAKTKIALSGFLLPVTLAIDILVIVPLFIFEINLAYFVTQLNGSRKTKHFAEANKQAQQAASHGEEMDSVFEFKASPADRFTETMKHLYTISSTIDPIKFPLHADLPPPNYTPRKEIAAELIHMFQESLDPDVLARHNLDEELVALDLDRALRKGAKEYVKKLK
ncbi:hypothetical protein PTTG_08741 [Puccinia triticina 1-1 BBBD Race 1]|uniref:Uncharacterized protein n=2 Tax=Puccinia triticina TaxID=208348 RepID=A0A180GAU3_PUCT1|nr:uncharacterized protein PtA15_9A29 [Puccinia triticina]OAV89714.1 hypothetical protein PTTG_08741 [Puccinia triticina 1-1 BBBD Race 1]WAQ87905.1 hypothetical protein PtA15_9A29 [Puccinia triticina]